MLRDRSLNQDLLKQAIKQNDKDLFLYLLHQDPSLAHEPFPKLTYTPLHLCCEFKRTDMAKLLVNDHNAEIELLCQLTGYTPLMYACQVGATDIAKWLVEECEAEIEVRSQLSGRSCTDIASEASFDKISDILQNRKDQIKKLQKQNNTENKSLI